MIKIPALRLSAILFLVLGLSACGFHLRNKIALPADLGPVRVTSTTPYSPLAESLATGLKHAGAILIRPTSLTEIKRTAREGLLMPPKSTFFTPKLRTGLVLRPTTRLPN